MSSLATAASFAELEWKSTLKTIKVHPLQASKTVPFSFTNTGKEPVTILRLKPGCGCITGKVDKKTFAPGETGTVQVTFNLQDRAGPQLKGLTVETSGNKLKRTKLNIKTSIAKTYALPVKRLLWKAGEEHSPKSIRLINANSMPFPLEKALAARDGLTIELKTIRVGFEYELIITPSIELSKTMIPVIIHPAKPESLAAVRTFRIYAHVK